jgi:hypothetical protein
MSSQLHRHMRRFNAGVYKPDRNANPASVSICFSRQWLRVAIRVCCCVCLTINIWIDGRWSINPSSGVWPMSLWLDAISTDYDAENHLPPENLYLVWDITWWACWTVKSRWRLLSQFPVGAWQVMVFQSQTTRVLRILPDFIYGIC